eukprot:COSAG02_NODE_170_length_31534_cov_33.568498_2_plen_239_part_00
MRARQTTDAPASCRTYAMIPPVQCALNFPPCVSTVYCWTLSVNDWVCWRRLLQYSCVYVILNTDNEELPAGYGLTFTLGRGNEIVAAMCEALEHLVVGKSLEDDILSDLMGFSRTLTQDGQLRWIGPEKGVLALACGAILNAVWDMWARREQKPLWEMVCDMEPEELVKVIDFKHITDVITEAEALELLKSKRPGWQSRKELMKTQGYPAYTTSAGWLGYPEEKIRGLCKELLADGHK